MTAAPVPEFTPATAADLGHAITYVSPKTTPRGEVQWRSCCTCHLWWLLDPTEAEAAFLRLGRMFR